MPLQDFFVRLSNPLIAAILRSPAHGLLSSNTMLITFRGSKSGRTFTTPVNYLDVDGNLWVISFAERRWWRNLRGGQPVKVLLGGREYPARAEAIEEQAGVAQALLTCLQKTPGAARYLGIKLDPSGNPLSADVALAAQPRVMIRINPEGRA